MKKNLLLTFLFSSVIGTAAFAQASCTPNLSCVGTATEGICPDSATGIPSANIGTAYNTTVSVKIPTSYDYNGTVYNFTHFAITNVTVDTTTGGSGNFVPLASIGLTYLGNGTNTPSGGANAIPSYTMSKFAYWAAPGSGCVIVSGTPNKIGTFPIKIESQIRTLVFGSGVWIPAPENLDYRMVVMPPAGIESASALKFDVKQNTPNPFSGNSKIEFSTANPTDVEFKVFNMLGSVVYSKNIKAEKGLNTLELDANVFAPGVYVYSMKSSGKTITKRMVVSGK
jgi:hypothetical protein